jgi:hypothetical protein
MRDIIWIGIVCHNLKYKVYLGYATQGHPASRMYSGGEPGAGTLRLVVQSSRTASFRY